MAILKLSRWPSFFLFVLAGLAAIVFAYSTFNLFSHAMANLEFVFKYTWTAVLNGALVQAIELLLMGGISLICWLIFKTCEQILIGRYLDWSKK